MSVYDLMYGFYAWCDDFALWILLASVLLPAIGAGVAWIGKGGRTDEDGRMIASVVVGAGLFALTFEIVALVVAHSVLYLDILTANAILLIAPPVFLASAVFGVRLAFPLNELGSVRSFIDVGVFVAACLAVVWFFSMFRGWGIVFFGGITQLLVIGALAFFLLRRLYMRAFGGRRPGRAPAKW